MMYYSWEIEHRDQTIGGKTILAAEARSGNGANALTILWSNQFAVQVTGRGGGIVPAALAVDRRRLSVAVVNCLANGAERRGDQCASQ